MHILKLAEFNDGWGNWHCADNTTVNSAYWWLIPRMLKMELPDYVKWLKETYCPDKITYTAKGHVLIYSWRNQSQMRKFKNYINKKARETNFMVD